MAADDSLVRPSAVSEKNTPTFFGSLPEHEKEGARPAPRPDPGTVMTGSCAAIGEGA